MTHLLTLTYCHLLAVLISHLKYLHFLKIISNISFQRFMFQISKHYLCICNCRLAFCVLPSCIKQCVNTSKCLFICIAKIHFVDTDFICLVTAQMQEFDSKKWLKGKNAHKTCWKKKFYHCCELTTQNMKNIKKIQESAVHGNLLDINTITHSAIIDKIPENIKIYCFVNFAHP